MFKSTLLEQILKLLPAGCVRRAAATYGADRYVKRFDTRTHLVAMLVAQLSEAKNLRGVELLLSVHRRRLYHLGARRVRRSTLSYANRHRTPAVFAAIASELMAQASRRKRQEAQEMLLAVDSTPIRLAGRGHEWAAATRLRNGNQGLKLHLCVNVQDRSLHWQDITPMNVNDLVAAVCSLPLRAKATYVFDKAYCDYNWWRRIREAGAHFITRLKTNAAFEIVEERPVDGRKILADQVIVLTNRQPRGGKVNRLAGERLRLVRIPHPRGEDRPFWIVSSLLEEPAETIAEGYRLRWCIENTFKWLKQNLEIKRFLGENENAIRIQIYVALIAHLLIHLYKRLQRQTTRASHLLTLINTNLFHPQPDPITEPPPDPPRQHTFLSLLNVQKISP